MRVIKKYVNVTDITQICQLGRYVLACRYGQNDPLEVLSVRKIDYGMYRNNIRSGGLVLVDWWVLVAY